MASRPHYEVSVIESSNCLHHPVFWVVGGLLLAGLYTSKYGGHMKSHVSNLLELAICILKDAAAKCTVTLDVRDVNTLTSRIEHEGLSFLTITLPTLGQDLEKALAAGQIGSRQFRSFRKNRKAPAFLRGYFSRVFDEKGRIYDEPCVEAIGCIRQVAYAFKKLQVPCKPERVRRALAQFVVDERIFEVPILQGDFDDFCQVSRCLWGNVFGSEISLLSSAIPKHGPGATAERLSGNAKYLMQRWHDRLEPYFPVLDTAFVNANAMESPEFEKVKIVEEHEEQPVRVIPVPKTLKTPRIIAIEPVCMQYAQQALSEQIVSLLESHDLTRGHVNFTNQQVNRDLALSSSSDERFATLDLSSASDRVPYAIAIRMFDSNPDLRDAISACRSKTAQMPDGELVPLSKFASMGSALCFPVEAMYFYTVCVVALLRKRNLPLTLPHIETVCGEVYVYGDDILVPTNEAVYVSETLQKYYCKVNATKSFLSGKFRESCGMDAYDGREVTPTYIRRTPPRNKRSASELVSWVATANLFVKKGYHRTAEALFQRAEALLGKLPEVGEQFAGLGRIVQSGEPVSVHKWHKTFQSPRVKAWVGEPVYRFDPLDGYPALLKSLLSLARKPEVVIERDRRAPALVRAAEQLAVPFDEGNLRRTARHGALALKRRWILPY